MTEKQQRMSLICQLISDDMGRAAAALDGRSFSPKVVARQFGENMAAIQALAKICKEIIEGSADA